MRFKIIINLMLVLVICIAGWYGYKKFFTPKPEPMFKTQKPERRNVYNKVQAEGKLEAPGVSKIGPFITNGTVKKILVSENQDVKEGQLLATLDNGYGGNEGDTMLREKKAVLAQSKATLDYSHANYLRQKALFQAGQLSQDKFESITKDYLLNKADLKNKQADYEKELYQFENTKVKAPHDGTILSIPVQEGEAVSSTTSPPTVLFRIARDLSTMKVNLSVDESKVGDLKIGQKVKIKVDTYPYRAWKGKIESIGKDPYLEDSLSQGAARKTVFYKTELKIKDVEQLLRPGMTVHADITVGKAKKVLALPGFVFQISEKTVEALAKAVEYSVKKVNVAKKKELKKIGAEHPHKCIWVERGKEFVETAVEIGISDNAYYEIRSGLTENDSVVFDITETDAMKGLIKAWVGGGL
jgi:RND family efflux transporter MFP subunit